MSKPQSFTLEMNRIGFCVKMQEGRDCKINNKTAPLAWTEPANTLSRLCNSPEPPFDLDGNMNLDWGKKERLQASTICRLMGDDVRMVLES